VRSNFELLWNFPSVRWELNEADVRPWAGNPKKPHNEFLRLTDNFLGMSGIGQRDLTSNTTGTGCRRARPATRDTELPYEAWAGAFAVAYGWRDEPILNERFRAWHASFQSCPLQWLDFDRADAGLCIWSWRLWLSAAQCARCCGADSSTIGPTFSARLIRRETLTG
jgi:hypothetical protein